MRVLARIGAALAACLITAGAQAAETVTADHVVLSLALEQPLQPGGTAWAAVRQDIAPGWHTYWRNPGDAGLATSLDWTLPHGVSAGATAWPTPEYFSDGTTVDYGYARTATLLVPLTAAKDAKIGTATVHVALLECQHMCIPEDVTLTIDLRQAQAAPGEFADARAAMPAVYRGAVRSYVSDGRLHLAFDAHGPVRAGAVQIFPASPHLLAENARPAITSNGTAVAWSAPLNKHRAVPRTFAGVIAVPGVGAFAFETPVDDAPRQAPPAQADFSAVLTALLFAFLGGLVLNVMPCVLPILSMKALMLAQSGESLSEARHEGLSYGAGVLASFAAMAGLLLALKAGGAAIGWGFQLQSPAVVLVLALLMAAIGFNMLGTFEVPMSVAGLGDGLTRRGGTMGAFFTGVLAVVVASPCTAPFMGTALGFALVQPAVVAFGIFLALGIGFAAPMTALAFTPGLTKLIPRPGVWMTKLRQFLAFPMFATAIWLLWILGQQSGPQSVVAALSVGLGAVFVFWAANLLPGRWQAVAAIVGIASLAGAAHWAGADAPERSRGDGWQPWSNAAVEEARGAGHPVFVDFTAAWCVTCQVNERVALQDPSVVEALHAAKFAVFKADWTHRDAAIATELAAHGRAGVPLYLVYPADAAKPPVELPQLLTPAAVVRALHSLAPVRTADTQEGGDRDAGLAARAP